MELISTLLRQSLRNISTSEMGLSKNPNSKAKSTKERDRMEDRVKGFSKFESM